MNTSLDRAEIGILYEGILQPPEHAHEPSKFSHAVQHFKRGSGQILDILQKLRPMMGRAKEQGLSFNEFAVVLSKEHDIRIQNMDGDIIGELQQVYDA